MELTNRKKRILRAIVEIYISTAEPVGSKAVAEQAGLDISTATIRNEMADLTELGYLEQPHTSAGRIPSPMGYRLYVNELMGEPPAAHHSGDRAHQPGAEPENGGAGPGHRPGGQGALPDQRLPRLYHGPAQAAGDGEAVRPADGRGKRLYRCGDDRQLGGAQQAHPPVR